MMVILQKKFHRLKLEVQKEIRMIYHPRIKPYRLTPIITTASPTNTE